MTRLNPNFTSRKRLDITYPAPQETLLGTPEILPTTEPAAPQIGYTVQGSDLPTFSLSPYKKVWLAYVFGAGKAVTAATVSWRMKKNGVSVNSGNFSVAANTFYTVMAKFLDVNVGDVLELSLWSNQADSNWDYKAFCVVVTRLILMEKLRLLSPCSFAALADKPVLTLGNPSVATYTGFYIYHADTYLGGLVTGATTRAWLYAGDTYGVFRHWHGDYDAPNSVEARTSASYRPYYRRVWCPTQIVMRGVNVG